MMSFVAACTPTDGSGLHVCAYKLHFTPHPSPVSGMYMGVSLQPDKMHKRDWKGSDLMLLLFREGKLGYFASYY
jgi:hypothetical protein